MYPSQMSFTDRQESPLERMALNVRGRGMGLQRMMKKNGVPLLAIKHKTYVDTEERRLGYQGGILRLRTPTEALTTLRIAQGYSTAYDLSLRLVGPRLAASGIYVTWVAFTEKPNVL